MREEQTWRSERMMLSRPYASLAKIRAGVRSCMAYRRDALSAMAARCASAASSTLIPSVWALMAMICI